MVATNDYVPLATYRNHAAEIEHNAISVAIPDPSVDDFDSQLHDPTLRRVTPSIVSSSPRHPRRHLRRFTAFFRDNAGLLLIALSQGFASLMGVFVKKLNALDPPVHPLEVSIDTPTTSADRK